MNDLGLLLREVLSAFTTGEHSAGRAEHDQRDRHGGAKDGKVREQSKLALSYQPSVWAEGVEA
jgi:hypothetical protein